jgi:uncharacterized phage protein (TIGR01671 family)
MREILYRGKQINTEKWVYGNLLKSNQGTVYIYPSRIIEDDGHHIRLDTDEPWWVIPETVGQYTGLKDDNGDPIFQGDIVRDQFRNIGVVKYSDRFLDWRIRFYKGWDRLTKAKEHGARMFDWVYPKMCLKIIGNIHDAPELLERGNEE